MSTKKDEWRARLAEWTASGQSPEQFAARHGVTVRALKWWRWKLGDDAARAKALAATRVAAKSAPGLAAFVEVVVAPPALISFEVLLRTGQVVRVPAGFDVDALRRLLRALEMTP